MFVKKDTRKVTEILYDANDQRSDLKLARREAEFSAGTRVLFDSTHASQLTNVKYLSLYGNKLTQLDQLSTLAASAVDLEDLNIGHNDLRELPSALAHVRTLRRLWAEDNALTAVSPCLLHLKELRTLRLSNNKIATIPFGIGKLSHLEELVSLHIGELSPKAAFYCTAHC
jgi:Leucine-rich repeat (LRR) protein